METMNKVDEFLDLYKQLEEALEERYRGKKRHYSGVVFEFTKDEDSAPVREKAEVCREIRNLLTHNSNMGGEPIVEPSQPVLDALREVLDFVRKPPLALDCATGIDRILKAGMDHKVLKLMETMDKKGYSHIPVMENGELRGVFSVGSLFRYQLRTGGRAITSATTLRDLKEDLELGSHTENYVFVPKTATRSSVRKLFERVEGRNRRVSAVFITENGRPRERLLGMLTVWDLLGDPEEQ